MAKQSGLGDRLFVQGRDLSGDIGSLERIGGGPALQNVTPINKSAMERIGLLRDGAMAFSSFFNPAAAQAHDTFNDLPTTDVNLTYCRGALLGSPSAAFVAKQLNYDGTRTADGSLTFSIEAQANGYGVEWGDQLTAGQRTDSAPTNGTGVDFAASTAFGLQVYYHVFSFTGTDVTIKLQDSADDISYADLAGTSFIRSAPGRAVTRLAITGTVRRYVRVSTVTTGGFSSVVFAATVIKNTSTVAF